MDESHPTLSFRQAVEWLDSIGALEPEAEQKPSE
jgi:hypothetical protein